MNVTYRKMRQTDWPEIVEIVRKQWADLPEIPKGLAQDLAARIDTHLCLKEARRGMVAVDTDSDAIVGVIAYRGPKPLPNRMKGWHEIEIAKALEAGDKQLDSENAAYLHAFEADMRRFAAEMRTHDPRTYDGGIMLLILDPAYHRQGIGRTLMNGAVAWCVKQGSTWLYLDTDYDLNYKFYERLGWTRVAEIPTKVNIFGKDYEEPALIYELEL